MNPDQLRQELDDIAGHPATGPVREFIDDVHRRLMSYYPASPDTETNTINERREQQAIH